MKISKPRSDNDYASYTHYQQEVKMLSVAISMLIDELDKANDRISNLEQLISLK